MVSYWSSLAVVAATLPLSLAGLEQIEHVVLFMQENRAFDHYFGTMAGVRGFQDPNVQINPNGKSVFYQKVTPNISTATDYLLPFHINYKGDPNSPATQCFLAGDNGLQKNQAALAAGTNDHWVTDQKPVSWSHYSRPQIPVQFAVNDAWTVGDMYQESVIASTDPNRISWIAGSINMIGSPPGNGTGGPFIDNTQTPGQCEKVGISDQEWSCYPAMYKTVPEYLEGAGIDWKVFQSADNFDDNPLAWFKQFQDAMIYQPTGPLATKGMSRQGVRLGGVEAFKKAANDGTLPPVSYIIGPAEVSEHPPFAPQAGGDFIKLVIDAFTSSPIYNKSVLLLSYDETGGWGDHVIPYHDLDDTIPGSGEWYHNPFNLEKTYSGPGFRVPFSVVSPWSRGGNVFTELADHSSQTLFLEKWAAAKGKPFKNLEMNHWRREHMSDLVNSLDFNNPDYSVPVLPTAGSGALTTGVAGLGTLLDNTACLALYPNGAPDVPYGTQTEATALAVEAGSRAVRGYLTEGRHLVFVSYTSSHALAYDPTHKSAVTAAPATPIHSEPNQRLVAHYSAGTPSPNSPFKLVFSAAPVGQGYLTATGAVGSLAQAADWTITPTTTGYTISSGNVNLGTTATGLTTSGAGDKFKIVSVTY